MAKDKTTDISKSKAKREERKKEVARERRNKLIARIISFAIIVAIAAVIAAAAGKNIYLAAIRTKSNANTSTGLTAEGKIDGVDVKNALTLVDYANISIPADEVAAKDEEVEEDIKKTLESHKIDDTDTTRKIADGDEVNIDYVGTIDGVEFEGGNSNSAGYNLTIGSGSFIDDFEQQLIGHSPGENMTVDVTFPDDYTDAAVAGKDASFAVTINSIKIMPELTDEFVAANLSGDGEEPITTAEAYRESVKERFHEQRLKEYLEKYIIDNSAVKSYPQAYLKAAREITKYTDESMMEYYKQMFASYGGSGYENLWDMRGEEINDELSYEKELRERAKESVKSALVYQAIFEDAKLSIDMEAVYAKMTEENGEDYVKQLKETNGEGSLAQTEINKAVIEYLVGYYKNK